MNRTESLFSCRYIFLIVLLLALIGQLCGQYVEIGYAEGLASGLPIRPFAQYSYTQQLFEAGEIGFQGSIIKLSFHYQVSSSNFYQGNKNWRIFLGHSSSDALEDWVDAEDLTEVFSGDLALDWFLGGLPGSSWLQIPLQIPFEYDGTSNLLLAIDENSVGSSSSSDGFYSWPTGQNRALRFISNSLNPDPFAPPQDPRNLQELNHLRLYFEEAVQIEAPKHLYGYYTGQKARLFWREPLHNQPLHYRINRDGIEVGTSVLPTYDDYGAEPGYIYHYTVQAFYGSLGYSVPSNAYYLGIEDDAAPCLLFESFEDCPSFSQQTADFINLDRDEAGTWGFSEIDFPGEGSAMGWLVFAPEECIPPLQIGSYISGAKFLVSLCNTLPPNDDWLISPKLRPGQNGKLSFYAGRLSPEYGAERMRVLYSFGSSDPEDFIPLHPEPYIAVQSEWEEYSFDLSLFEGLDIRLAINGVSLDAYALCIDHLQISGFGAELGLEDELAPLIHPYPNPSRGAFRLKSEEYFKLSLYNLKGQKLYQSGLKREFDSAALNLKAGLYLLKVESGGQTHYFKQIVLP